jgi:Lrp/AsnC family leucine-responsive transcriptional regulator
MIDYVDRQILAILQEDARTANSDIAKQVGMAPSATHERIKKLRERGVISGFETRVNPSAVGLGIVAFIFVRTDEMISGNNVGIELKRIPEILEVHNIAGEDCYLIKVRVKDTFALSEFLRDPIGRIPSITSTRTTIALETYKETIALPLREEKPELANARG